MTYGNKHKLENMKDEGELYVISSLLVISMPAKSPVILFLLDLHYTQTCLKPIDPRETILRGMNVKELIKIII